MTWVFQPVELTSMTLVGLSAVELEVLDALQAGVALGVVADDVDLPVATQPPPQFLQVPEEQLGVVPLLGGAASVRNTAPVLQWIEPERYRFLLVPGISTSACCCLSIPIRPILGLVWISTSSCQTTVSSSGSSASSFRNLSNLA
jgi:hypothetical protein